MRGMVFVVVGLLGVVLFLLAFRRETPQLVRARINRTAAKSYERKFVVSVNEEFVSVKRPDGTVERASWPELCAVRIITTDSGPYVCDFWYILTDNTRTCAIPQGATGEDELLQTLQNLPDWDNDRAIEALGSTSNNEYLCWKRPGT